MRRPGTSPRQLLAPLGCLLLACLWTASARAAEDETPGALEAAEPAHEADEDRDDEAAEAEPDWEEEEEDEGLRQRLTEREDKRRPERPWYVMLGGRPLTVSGEFESNVSYLSQVTLGDPDDREDRLLSEQELEVETFYSFGHPLSLFAQVRFGWEQDLFAGDFDGRSEGYVERGEMWLYSEDIAGTHLNLEVGRLNFEDDRRWWWDEDLDAIRVAYERDTYEIVFAAAQELAPARTSQNAIDPEHDGVLRLFGEVGWDYLPEHALELFVLHQDDHSHRESPDEIVLSAREDDSDARLTWVGARLTGAWELESRGIFGYWLDTGYVTGEEWLTDFEELPGHTSQAGESTRRSVSGWAVDAGATWILAGRWEPRLFAGYALGSGDSSPEEGSDRAYRQTGLEANEAGFGGVEHFGHYGVLLDPELSNLGVATLGTGLSLFRASSIDLVYHHYRQVDPAPFLRDARIDGVLTGTSRDVGNELDLVLSLEEWKRLEFQFVASAFRAGRAYGVDAGDWSYGAFLAMRINF